MTQETPDAPLPYLERIRSWYLALGYPTPYHWAQIDDVAFTQLAKPASDMRLAMITTAAPHRDNAGEQGPGAPYNGLAKFQSVFAASTETPPVLGLSHLAIDRAHTTGEDPASYFPRDAFSRCVASGLLGSLSPRFYGLPTDRSQHRTRNTFAPEILALCQEDRVDAVVLIPNCPVCHQSVALVANHLESAGIPTVIMGCAKDIVEHVGAPRLVFSDLPLGNAAGPPGDNQTQDTLAQHALKLLATATRARTTEQSAARWPGAANWKRDYANVALLTDTELAARRDEFDRVKRERDRSR